MLAAWDGVKVGGFVSFFNGEATSSKNFFIMGISSQQLQHLSSYWGFSDLGRGVSPDGRSSEVQPALLTLDVGNLFMAAPAKFK